MERYLAPRQEDACARTKLPPHVTQYLTTVLQQARRGEIHLRSQRELRTLAESLDHLLSGRLAQLGDMLMQRFKAVEETTGGTPWEVARHLELTPHQDVGAASQQELRWAAQAEMEHGRLARHLDKGSRWDGPTS